MGAPVSAKRDILDRFSLLGSLPHLMLQRNKLLEVHKCAQVNGRY
jgi:hypothetical protein